MQIIISGEINDDRAFIFEEALVENQEVFKKVHFAYF
jgi:hypothetical protein